MADSKEFAREIRKVGEALIKNADVIAGSDEFIDEIDISVTLSNRGIPGMSWGVDSDIKISIEKSVRI